MIFTPVNKLTNENKAFFIEQIQLYVKLVDAFCLKNKINNTSTNDIINEDELKSIGVIESKEELVALKTLLKSDYLSFIKAVNFAVDNKEKLNGLLDKLYNSKRAELQ